MVFLNNKERYASAVHIYYAYGKWFVFFKYCIVIKLTDLKKNLQCKTLQQKENSNFACAQTTNVMIKIDTNFINLKVETKLKNQ